jgi:hypothetical protein
MDRRDDRGAKARVGGSRLAPAERALILATLERFSGALPMPQTPSVRMVTEVGSSPSRPLLRT